MSASKEELYKLVDSLPEQKLAAAIKLLETLLRNDTWKAILKNPPEVNEPLTDEDLKAIEEAEKDITAGNVQPWEEIKKELGL